MAKVLLAAAAAAAALGATSADSAAVTTGCDFTDTCTLANLSAGGTLQVDDVLFSGFSVLINTDFEGGLAVDPAALFVTGISSSATAGLRFVFQPTLAVTDAEVEFDLAYFATIVAPSSRTIVGAALGDFGSVATSDAFVEVGTTTGGASPALALENAPPEPAQDVDSVAFAGLGLLNLETDVQLGAFVTGATAELGEFAVTLDLEGGSDPALIPLPAGGALLLTGIAGIALLRRRVH